MAKAVVIMERVANIADALNERLKTVDPISVSVLEVYAGQASVLLVYKSRFEGSKKSDESNDKNEQRATDAGSDITLRGSADGAGKASGRRSQRGKSGAKKS